MTYALYPSAHDESVSEILGFIRSIDEEEVEQHIRKDNAIEDEDEEEYILSDLEDYDNQRDYIEANPSTSRSYNYSKKRKFSDKTEDNEESDDNEELEDEEVYEEEIQSNNDEDNDNFDQDIQEIMNEGEKIKLSKKERRRANRRLKYTE